MKFLTTILKTTLICSSFVAPLFAISIDEQIQYYTKSLEKNPNDYASKSELGLAYFFKTQATYDPKWIKLARKETLESINIQPSTSAFKTMANIQNYSHQFEETLKWADKTLLDTPDDGQLTAIKVESLMAQGKTKEARALLPKTLKEVKNFYLAGALGQYYSHTHQYDKSLEAFNAAVAMVNTQELAALYAWAKVSAAGTRVDSGHLDEAKIILKEVEKINPTYKNYRIHVAEVHLGENHPELALKIYEEMLKTDPDPAVYHLAYTASKLAKMNEIAKEYLQKAFDGYNAVLEADEIYYLGALNALYDETKIQKPEKVLKLIKIHKSMLDNHHH